MNATPGGSSQLRKHISHLPRNKVVRIPANRGSSSFVQLRRCVREPELGGRPSLRMRVHAAATAEPLEPRQADATDGSTRPRQIGKGQRAVVAGAGPAGILTALLLTQRGYQVDLFEKRPAPSEQEIKHGSRSIVFGLAHRGQKALRQAGIRLPQPGGDSIWLNGLAVSRGAYHHRFIDGNVTTSFDRLPPALLLVERAALMEHMMLELERLEPQRIRLHYGCGLAGVDLNAKTARFVQEDGTERAVGYDLLVGCDGRNSGVRAALQAADPSFRHEEYLSPRSYKGFHMLPPLEGVDVADESGVCITFNTCGRVLNYGITFWPTKRGTITGHLSVPREWFDTNPNTPESYAKLIAEKFPKFPEAWRAQTCEQLAEARAAPNGASVRCSKLHGPSTVLLGDAAHGVTPATGQGCNAALESAQMLVQVLEECDGDAEAAAPAFTAARLKDAHALFAIDRSARSRNGANGINFTLLATRFHVLLGMALKKLAPGRFQGAAYAASMTRSQPYSQIEGALMRDRNIFVALLVAATAALVALLRSLIPRVAAWFA